MFAFFAIAFDPAHVIDSEILDVHDKFKHICAFLVLSYFLFTSSVKIHYIFKFIILVFICFFIEYVQEMIGRQASLEDFLASFFGIVLFVVLRIIIRKFFIR